MTVESPSEALRRRSKAPVVIVGYPETGWGVSTRVEPSGPLLHCTGPSIDAACEKLLGVLDGKPPKPKLKLKR